MAEEKKQGFAALSEAERKLDEPTEKQSDHREAGEEKP
jgi:hypothetical protein